MSHEGIRLVSAEEAQRAPERELPREAVTPARVRVQQSTGEGLEIEWKDGHRSRWSFAWLRNGCPCATCEQERQAQGRKPGEGKPKPATLLPMYQEPARPNSASPVGNYAISFQWNDGHTSGIYSWDYLRRHCLCAECGESG
ncbi:MAG: gamma-butyrobetaine hydroxylase-like domain-containing protein [Acidobacteriota bacterium]